MVSKPDPLHLCATSLVAMVAVPPGWYLDDRRSCVLYATPSRLLSNHRFVRSHRVCLFCTLPQLTLVSVSPMISTALDAIYRRISSLFSLFSVAPIPLTFTKLMRTVLLSFSSILSPQSSLGGRRLRVTLFSVSRLEWHPSRRRRGVFGCELHIGFGATPIGIG